MGIFRQEPSFAEALAAFEAADLPAQKGRHWICSLRQVAKALDRPMESVPARWIAIRSQVAALHHQMVGMEPKTLANHRANVRAALHWFTGEKDIPRRGAPLLAEWERLHRELTGRRSFAILAGLMRFCSARSTVPSGVDEAVVDALLFSTVDRPERRR